MIIRLDIPFLWRTIGLSKRALPSKGGDESLWYGATNQFELAQDWAAFGHSKIAKNKEELQ